MNQGGFERLGARTSASLCVFENHLLETQNWVKTILSCVHAWLLEHEKGGGFSPTLLS